MAVDTTCEREKRRNRPLKYDRDLVGTTLRAMARASEVQDKRAARHFKNRMVGHKAKEAEKAREVIAKEHPERAQEKPRRDEETAKATAGFAAPKPLAIAAGADDQQRYV